MAFGGLPMLMAFYFHFTMHKTLTDTTGNKPVSTSWTIRLEIMEENATSLCGTAGCWFLLDVVFYTNGLFSDQGHRLP